jgi:hypothetical protein
VDEIAVPCFLEGCVVSKGLEIRELLEVRKETVLYIQPCASERGKLMADIEFSEDIDADFFDPEVLCSLLEIHRRRFAELKCSPTLGVAKVKWRGREISVFRNGKLKIQRAPTREEILKVANATARIVWGAALCGVCGQPALKCASGDCGRCRSGEAKESLRDIPGSELLRQAFTFLERAQKKPEEAEKCLRRSEYFTLHFVEETPDKKYAAAGLAFLAGVGRSVPFRTTSEPGTG